MMSGWKPNPTAPLWYSGGSHEPSGPFFSDLNIEHVKQQGPSCVATTLSMVANSTGANTTPEDFKEVTNSQAPHTWSEALKPYGLQLAYCNSDLRRLGYFIDELVEYDDLFLLSFFSKDPPSDPLPSGKLCTAHIITHCTRIPFTIRQRTNMQGEYALQMIIQGLKDRRRESSESFRCTIRGVSDEHGCSESQWDKVRNLSCIRSTTGDWTANQRQSKQTTGHGSPRCCHALPRQFWFA